MIPTVTNAYKLLRWVTEPGPPMSGHYATDGWWIVTVAGYPKDTKSVYDDGEVR